uniref:Eukaryotic translation initiation factor 3 subunit C N-terminal domain-containing protein n=1 Tax=Glossina brevipalpis TaxID=37001 RepID=A0A1A9W221_9MUSC
MKKLFIEKRKIKLCHVFFATGSDSESESGEEDVQVPTYAKAAAYQFSDEEEEVKRVVRSTKEKRYENLTALINNKIKDMSSILTSFEDLTRAYQKALPVISKEENGITPRFYVRCLAELEDFINDVWEDREGRKNLSKNNSKSLGTLRQKVRKYINDFEEELARFRQNPDQESDAEEEEPVTYDSENEKDDQESDDACRDIKQLPSEQKPIKAVVAKQDQEQDEDDDDDSVDWGSDTESESESSDGDNQYVIWDLFYESDRVREMLVKFIKKKNHCVLISSLIPMCTLL